MAGSRRALSAFALPLGVLGLAATAAWVSTTSFEPGLGPMKLVPFASRLAGPTASAQEAEQIPPTALEKLSPLEAVLRNALIPYTRAPLLAPARYQTDPTVEAAPAALQCLTAAVYYEAAREPLAGQRAVAQVVINRWASAPFPKTICGVVQQGAPQPGCQFTFECDGSLKHRPEPSAWANARRVAEAALAGSVDEDVGLATHYHADYVVPVWAPTLLKLFKVGHHIFYRWAGARPVPVALIVPPAEAAVLGPMSPLSPGVSATPLTPPALEEARPTGAAVAPEIPVAPLRSLSEPSAPTTPAAPLPTPAPVLVEPPTAQPDPRTAPTPRRALPEESLRSGPI